MSLLFLFEIKAIASVPILVVLGFVSAQNIYLFFIQFPRQNNNTRYL
jgi:hypothetical protein